MTQDTTQLVARLRWQIEHSRQHPDSPLTLGSLVHALAEAADHIEALEAKVETLRKALTIGRDWTESVALICGYHGCTPETCASKRAEQALAQIDQALGASHDLS